MGKSGTSTDLVDTPNSLHNVYLLLFANQGTTAYQAARDNPVYYVF